MNSSESNSFRFFHVIENFSKNVNIKDINAVMKSINEYCYRKVLEFTSENYISAKLYKGVCIYSSEFLDNLLVPAAVIAGKNSIILENFCEEHQMILTEEDVLSFEFNISLVEVDFKEIVNKVIEICGKHEGKYFSQIMIFQEEDAIKILAKIKDDDYKEFLSTQLMSNFSKFCLATTI